MVRLKNPRDDIDNDDDDVCKATKVDLVCTNCHLWRPNEQLPRGAPLLLYSMLSTLVKCLFFHIIFQRPGNSPKYPNAPDQF